MYGKIMSVPDRLVFDYAQALTDLPLQQIQKSLPREAKAGLAKEIVAIYHGKKASLAAEREFNRVFKEKKLPLKIPVMKIKKEFFNILELLVEIKMASSKAEAKRLIEQGGVKIDGETKKDWREKIEIKKGRIVQVGKRKFVRLI